MDTRRAQLVILDLDGTLVDSRLDIAAALNVGLQSVGAQAWPDARLFPYIGRPLDKIFTELLDDGDAEKAEAAAEAYRVHFFDHCADKSALYPNVRETLAALHASCFTAIGTTKRTFMAVRVAELLNFGGDLDYIQGTDDFPPKPDPTLLHHLMARFGIAAERTIMVGDTPTDILAAKAAGARSIAVTYGIGDPEVLAAADPDFTVADFGEIEAIADRLWERGR